MIRIVTNYIMLLNSYVLRASESPFRTRAVDPRRATRETNYRSLPRPCGRLYAWWDPPISPRCAFD